TTPTLNRRVVKIQDLGRGRSRENLIGPTAIWGPIKPRSILDESIQRKESCFYYHHNRFAGARTDSSPRISLRRTSPTSGGEDVGQEADLPGRRQTGI
ncbi:hypothetical protein CDAR_533391, partial [Caerostris darwini]